MKHDKSRSGCAHTRGSQHVLEKSTAMHDIHDSGIEPILSFLVLFSCPSSCMSFGLVGESFGPAAWIRHCCVLAAQALMGVQNFPRRKRLYSVRSEILMSFRSGTVLLNLMRLFVMIEGLEAYATRENALPASFRCRYDPLQDKRTLNLR